MGSLLIKMCKIQNYWPKNVALGTIAHQPQAPMVTVQLALASRSTLSACPVIRLALVEVITVKPYHVLMYQENKELIFTALQ